ncbi:MAG: DUF2339 domain-containing protein [Burkholderiaceae bacterium]
MVWWGIGWGVILGWLLPGGDWQMIPGAFFGFLAGLTLRAAVRREIQAASTKQPTRAASNEVVPPQPVNQAPRRVDAAEPNLTSPAQPAPVTQTATSIATTSAAASMANQSAVAAASPKIYPSTGPKTETAASAKPRDPSPVEQAAQAIKDWFMGGNTVARVGVVILFIGLSFLAKYAAQMGLFPVELRLATVGAAGIALLVVGFRLRSAKPAYAMTLQGAGVAVMYLTVFAAYRLYQMMPMGAAFALMVGVCALSVAIALLQDSRVLAVAAFAGGFATPLLVSTGQGNHVALFSYYALLNLAILYIAFKRTWRVLSIVGFLSTFGVATLWGVLRYEPQHYASAQGFLLLFFMIYVFTAVLNARGSATRLNSPVDSMLVFGAPLIGFGLQAGLVRGMEFGTAFSALAVAAFYLLLALWLARRARESARLLVECFLALGVGFATLAVPLALDARWTAAVWAAEGTGAFWVGMRQARWMPRAFGLALQAVAALALLGSLERGIVSTMPFANPAFIGALLLALPAIAIAWWTRSDLPHSGSRWAKAYAPLEKNLSSPAYLYGFFWWVAALAFEIVRSVPTESGSFDAVLQQYQPNLLMLAFVASAAFSSRIATKFQWPVAAWPANATLPVMAIILLINLLSGTRVFEGGGWVIWPLALMAHYWLLHRADTVVTQQAPLAWRRAVHAAGVWLIVLLLADMLWYAIDQGDLWRTAWATVALLVSATVILFALAAWAGKLRTPARWPLAQHRSAYLWVAAAPLAVVVFVGAVLVAVGSAGNTQPLPYIPLLNPTDLSIALALASLIYWRLRLKGTDTALPAAMQERGPLIAVALAVFIAINTVWLRIAHHFFEVQWNAGALFSSFVVQTGYAILWTLLALALMLVAHRRVLRPLWMVGAALLAITVVKLFFIDLSNAGGGERIVAFIAVGALMLLVGYLAPIPPRDVENARTAES